MEIKYKIVDENLFINSEIFKLENIDFIKELGTGANAKAFLVKNTVTEREECVKIWTYTDKYKDNEDKFRKEVEKNSKFTDLPNVATIYSGDVKTMDKFNVCYCVLEYIEGINLKEYLKKEYKPIFRYRILDKILFTMDEIYKRGYHHGDLHIENIIIPDNDERDPCIIDFGTSFFSGEIKSNCRDKKLLYELCINVMPELNELPFVIKQEKFNSEYTSEFLCGYMQYLLNIWWCYKCIDKDIDDYGIKEMCLNAILFNDKYASIEDKEEELINYLIKLVEKEETVRKAWENLKKL